MGTGSTEGVIPNNGAWGYTPQTPETFDQTTLTPNISTIIPSGTYVTPSIVPVNLADPKYSAVAGGVTDNLAAFVAAEADAYSTGRPLYIPAGTWLITLTAGTNTLNLRVPLIGAGQTFTTLKFAPDTVTFSVFGFTIPSAVEGYISDITIAGPTIFGRSVIPVNQGAYNSGTTYAIDDVVTNGGHTFISLASVNTGNTPVNSTSTAWWIDLNQSGSMSTPGSNFQYGQVAMYGDVQELYNAQAVLKLANNSTTMGPGLTLERVTISGKWKNSIQTGGGSLTLNVRNCDFTSWGPLSMNGTDTFKTYLIASNTNFRGDTLLYNNQKHNIYPNRQVAPSITNCRFYDRHGGGYALHHHSSAGTSAPDFFLVDGCMFDTTIDNNILCAEALTEGIISRCVFNGTGNITFINPAIAANMTISNCQFVGAGTITTSGTGGSLANVFSILGCKFVAGKIVCGSATTWNASTWAIRDCEVIGAITGVFIDSSNTEGVINISNLVVQSSAAISTYLINLQKSGRVTWLGGKVLGSCTSGVFRCTTALGATSGYLDVANVEFRQTAGDTFPTTVVASWSDRIMMRDCFFAHVSTTGNQPRLPTGVRGKVRPRQIAAPQITAITDGVTTNASATVTSAGATLSATLEGTPIQGTGIPAGTYVKSVESSTSLTMSANATATGSSLTITFGVMASAARIAPSLNFDTYHVSGTTTIDNITPHNTTSSPNPQNAWAGFLYLIADAAWSTSSAGNIVPKTTAARTAGNVVSLRYDQVDGKWYEVA